jgi:6-phosphogluconolactonase
MTTPEVLRHPDAQSLAQSTAAMLAARLIERQQASGLARIVLTGGTIGTAVLAELGASPSRDAVDWSAVELWWGDERFLPTGDPDRNDTGAQAALLDAVGLDPARVHRIPGPDLATNAEQAAEQYAALLRAQTRPDDHGDVPRFDVVLLGIGPDAHVASLFPEHPALHVTEQMTAAVHGSPKPPATRVTLTLPALNAATDVWILASGEEKASAVRLALDPTAGFLQVPASGVHGRDRTLFLVDEAAASKLPASMGRPVA